MKGREIAFKYAKALMESSLKEQDLSQRLINLENLAKLLDRAPQFRYFLTSPQVEDKEKEEVLKIALQDETLINLVWDLLKKHRLQALEKIVEQYKHGVNQKLKRVEAYIVSPTSVDPALQEDLKERLEKHFNKKVDLQQELDPRLIGGGILLIGNQSIDFSVKDRLDKLRKAMMSVKVETKKS